MRAPSGTRWTRRAPRSSLPTARATSYASRPTSAYERGVGAAAGRAADVAGPPRRRRTERGDPAVALRTRAGRPPPPMPPSPAPRQRPAAGAPLECAGAAPFGVPPKKAWQPVVDGRGSQRHADHRRVPQDAGGRRAGGRPPCYHGRPRELPRRGGGGTRAPRHRRGAAPAGRAPEAAPAPEGAARGEETGAEATDAERLPGRPRKSAAASSTTTVWRASSGFGGAAPPPRDGARAAISTTPRAARHQGKAHQLPEAGRHARPTRASRGTRTP